MKKNSTLYVGVTSNLMKRIYEHKYKIFNGFSSLYNLKKLVYIEYTPSMSAAIEREKYIKGKTRKFKETIIQAKNPQWKDLSYQLFGF